MATLDELSRALIAADKAGDAQAAKILAGEISRMRSASSAPKANPNEFAFDPMRDMSTGERFLAGVGKAFTDLGRGAGQLVGAVSRKDVAEARKLDAPLMGTTAGAVGNIAGNVAMLAPSAMIPGANTIAGGAAIGAATGLLQPSTSTMETASNVGLGGAAGAVVPLASRLIKTGKAAAEPFYESGRNAIVGRAINKAAGKDSQAVVQRLREASQPFVGPSQGVPRTVMGEYVPGSLPTVGQASGNAGVASLERAAVATNPEVTNAVSDIMKAQNAARVGVLDDMAGRDGAREFFASARDATARQLYGDARAAGIDPARLTPELQQKFAQLTQRVPDEVMNRAKQLAKINGSPMDNGTSIQGMHWIKMAIDDLAGAAKRSGNDTLHAAYVGLQKDLLAGMDQLSPAYQTARQTYQAMSQPVNRMDVAGEIIDKSVDKLTGNIQPRPYAKALSDATAARATGLQGATMEGTMAPAQMNQLQSILLDLQRSNAAQNAGRGVGSDTVQKLAYGNILDQAGVPTFLRELSPAQVVGGLTGRAADAAYARANRELSNRLAEVMLDPAQAAQLMTQATPQEMSQMLKLLSRSGSGLAISAPASANAQKQ